LATKELFFHHGNAPSHTSFSPGIFFNKNTTVVLHTPYYSVSPIKDETKRRHFDTTAWSEAGLQAVLKTLAEHDFQDAFQNCKSAGNGAYTRKGTTSRVMVAGTPKVSF
jgi:hypothetical protein